MDYPTRRRRCFSVCSAKKRGKYAGDAKTSDTEGKRKRKKEKKREGKRTRERERERERGVVGSCKHEEESMFANKVVIPGHLLFGRYQQPTS